jgi:peptidoglycan/xylan/chitin deacetylase (PgdA/CDA1 family)
VFVTKNGLIILISVLLISTLWGGRAEDPGAKSIAFTFEKLPAMKPMGFWSPREISNQILRVLAAEEIKAIGFVVQEKIDDDPGSIIVLDDWLKQGHLLGNNTYSYVDLNELNYRDFLQHVADGQTSIRRLSLPTRIQFRHFRFPMLHEGNTESKKENVFKRLDRAGYKIIPATVIPTDYE